VVGYQAKVPLRVNCVCWISGFSSLPSSRLTRAHTRVVV
jgi:hypothetical protein